MKKVFLLTLIAGAACLFQACNTGSASNDGVDSVRQIGDVPSNRDTSKTTTEIGGATVLDNTASGGVRINKGVPTTSNTMAAPKAPAAATDTATAGTPEAKRDSIKK